MYPVKIEFKEYQSDSWQNWSEYLAEVPDISMRVESDNPGEAGAIVFDSASVTFRYETGNPVYQKFSVDLTTAHRYVFKISLLTPENTYTQKFEGIADFSTISWNEYENLITFDVIDRISAIGLLTTEQCRIPFSIKRRLSNSSPISTGLEFRYHNNWHTAIWISGFHPTVYDDLNIILVEPGEVIDIPEIIGGQSRLRVVTKSELATSPNTGKRANYIEFLPPLEQTTFNVIQWEEEDIDNIKAYEMEFYGVNINNIDSNGILLHLDGFKVIEALYSQVWQGINLIKIPGQLSYQVPAEYAIRLIGNNPFGQTPLDAFITMINSFKNSPSAVSGCYVYVDNDGNLVVQARDSLTSGTQRSIGQTKIISRKRKYFWDKLADGATVILKSWITDQKTGDYLEGKATVTLKPQGLTGFIKPKNEIKKELITMELPEPGQTPADFLVEASFNLATSILNFYGKRREAIYISLNIDANTINWNVLDYLTIGAINYFITQLNINPLSGQIDVEAAAVDGFDFNINTIIFPYNESNSYNHTSDTINTGGIFNQNNYSFLLPLKLDYGLVSLEITDNFKLTNNKLDTIQDILTTSTPTFNQINLSTPGTSGQAVRADRTVNTAAPLTGGGDLTANRSIGLSINATNLKLTSNALNTIQDITTTSSPSFNNLTLSGLLQLTAGTTNANSVAWGTEMYLFRSGANELRLTGGALRIFRNSNAALIIGDNGAGSSFMNITAATGQLGDIRFQTSNSLRWAVRKNSDSESGSNAGSNFVINRYDDSGALIDGAFMIRRNTGNVGIGNMLNPNEKLEVNGNIHLSGGDRTIFNRSSNYLALGTNNTERMRILSNGNIAIGTKGAPERLTVSGNIYLAGHIYSYGESLNFFHGNIEHIGMKALYNDFTSGWTGSGWRLGYDNTDERTAFANLELDNLWVRGTMTVYELIINQIRATNGSLFVSSTAKVESASEDSSYSIRIWFEDPEGHGVCPFVEDDILLMQRVRLDSTTVVKRIALRVMSVSGRVIEADYVGFTPSEPPVKGDLFVRIGNYSNANRRGSLYLTSDDSNAPYMDVVDGVAQWNDWGSSDKLKVRLGKLNGITDSFFGSLSGYGLYAKSNAYLRGKIYAESGGWIAGWSIDSNSLISPNVILSGEDNDVKLVANNSTGQVGVYVYHDKTAADVPEYISFGRTLSGTGTLENKFGISYKRGSTVFFELTNTDKSIAGWNFDGNRLWKDTVSLESGASMKGLVIDTDRIKIGQYEHTTTTMSNPLTNITHTILNGYNGINVSDPEWGIIGNWWDADNKIQDVSLELNDNLIRCVIGTEARTWNYRLIHRMFSHETKVLGKTFRVNFKLYFTPYPDYMEEGGTYEVAIRYYNSSWATVYRQVIHSGTVNNGLSTQTIDITGSNGIMVTLPASIPDATYAYIEWVFYGGAQSGTFFPKTMELTDVSFFGYENYKTWLNSTGLFMYNNDNNYIKLFADTAEVNIPILKMRGKQLIRYHGRLSVAPTADVEIGDMYIRIPDNKTLQCYDINNQGVPQWSPLN